MTDKITIQDCRAAGYCINPGVKKVCEEHGIDFRSFVRNGLDIEVAETYDSAFIQRVIGFAKKRIAEHGKEA